jgi:hypothetical protein
MSHGAYISQSQVRKHAANGGGVGHEILHTNIAAALDKLKLAHSDWDWRTVGEPDKYLAWLKRELVAGHPVVWFVMLKGESHDAHGLGNYGMIRVQVRVCVM